MEKSEEALTGMMGAGSEAAPCHAYAYGEGMGRKLVSSGQADTRGTSRRPPPSGGVRRPALGTRSTLPTTSLLALSVPGLGFL